MKIRMRGTPQKWIPTEAILLSFIPVWLYQCLEEHQCQCPLLRCPRTLHSRHSGDQGSVQATDEALPADKADRQTATTLATVAAAAVAAAAVDVATVATVVDVAGCWCCGGVAGPHLWCRCCCCGDVDTEDRHPASDTRPPPQWRADHCAGGRLHGHWCCTILPILFYSYL